jgi:hypothetical protein
LIIISYKKLHYYEQKKEQFRPGVLINGKLKKGLTIEKWAEEKFIRIEMDFELPPGALYISKIEKVARYYFVHYENKYQ